jgi:hypothetical protein
VIRSGFTVLAIGRHPDSIGLHLVANATELVDWFVLGFLGSQYEFNMLVEHHQVVRIVTALEQRIEDGNLSVHHRQQIQQQIALLRTKYPDCF